MDSIALEEVMGVLALDLVEEVAQAVVVAALQIISEVGVLMQLRWSLEIQNLKHPKLTAKANKEGLKVVKIDIKKVKPKQQALSNSL